MNYSAIPALTRETIDEYVRIGRPPGGFVRAVLEDSLTQAFAKADQYNRAAMFEIASYVYNKVPAPARWGGVDAWIEAGGLEGVRAGNEP
jgi:hypothetical protein